MIKSKKIQIIEDKQSLRTAMKIKFENVGFEVIESVNGEDGLRDAFAKKPDLILLDIILPVMDGWGLLKMLRDDEWGKHVPVIILTNLDADEKTMQNIVDYEPSFYFIKVNWTMEDLLDKVKERLSG